MPPKVRNARSSPVRGRAADGTFNRRLHTVAEPGPLQSVPGIPSHITRSPARRMEGDDNEENERSDRAPWGLLDEVRSWRKSVVSIHEVPMWLRYNKYIQGGYRPTTLTPREAIGSLFMYTHNETFNVFSHLLPCLLLLYFIFYPPVPQFFRTALGTTSAAFQSGDSAAFLAGEDKHNRYQHQQQGGGSWGSEAAYDEDYWRTRGASAAGVAPTVSVDPVGTGAAATAPLLTRRGLRGGSLPSGAALASYDDFDPASVVVPICISFLATFLLSIVYHLFMPCCRTRRGYQQLLQCDVSGVLTSITGSAYAYFVRGNPCTSPLVMKAAAVVMVASTFFTGYAILIAPIQEALLRDCGRVVLTVLACMVEGVCLCVEFIRAAPMEAPHPQSENVLAVLLWRGRCRYGKWRRAGAATPSSTFHTHHRHAQQPDGVESAGGSAGPVSVQQRAAIVGVHCLLHFVCYVVIVLPKSRAPHGFTQASFYYGMSYVFLMGGGAINATRVPERIVRHMEQQASDFALRRQHRLNMERLCHEKEYGSDKEEEEDITAPRHGGGQDRRRKTQGSVYHHQQRQQQRRGARGGEEDSSIFLSNRFPLSLQSLKASFHELRDRVSLCQLFTTYVISGAELDYIGNSHNIWHLCGVLSALCILTGAYYDCIEYELMRC